MQRILPIARNGSDSGTADAVTAKGAYEGSTRLNVVTGSPSCFQDLTAQVEAAVSASGIDSGTVTVRSMHTTAAVFLNEWQEALLADCQRLLELLVPDREDWKHNDPRYSDCERGNAAAHLRALLLGSSVRLPVRNGQIERGTWQSIIFAEFDGPRKRSVSVDILGQSGGEKRDV